MKNETFTIMRSINSICLVVLMILAITGTAKTKHGKPPTWSEEVACIIYTHCTPCHRDGGVAPFSISSYEEAFNERFSIRYSVSTGSMPPWPVNNDFNPLAHARNLNEWEKDRIIDWVNEGALRGDPSLEPALPQFADQGEIDEPNVLELSMEEYTNTLSTDNYRCFVIDPRNNKDWYIKAWEVLPGNVEMVHHVLIFSDTARQRIAQLDAADPGPGYASFGSTRSSSSMLIGGWTPGAKATRYPEGMAALVPAGGLIIMQVHYAPETKGQKDATSFRFLATEQPQRPVAYAPLLEHGRTMVNGPLFIPANTEKTFWSTMTSPIKGTLISVFPHMHLLGKSIKVWGIEPNNQDTIPIIDIPQWDFHWQGDYMFQKPIVIEAGTQLWVEATYDNTINNPENPNRPPKDVRLGEGTADEMLLVYFGFLVPSLPGDASVIIDTSSVTNYVKGCEGLLSIDEAFGIKQNDISIYPNPGTEMLHFTQPAHLPVAHVEIIDMWGRSTLYSSQISHQLDVSDLKPGLYTIRFWGEKNLLREKRWIKL